ncbi:SEC-C domain-containing protein [Pectobacterium aroidearum]|uniref:YecA family protein n=1 Tax=Pectobacterium aroidearum TaxID=1201031 RepID=UPI0032ED18F6
MVPLSIKEELLKSVSELLKDMEVTASQMRTLIVGMPPEDLLGYIYAQYMMSTITDGGDTSSEDDIDRHNDLINENQFLLEYVHAVLASDCVPDDVKFDETQCGELFELSRKLRQQAIFYAISSSADTKDGIFGPDTANIEFHAKTTWVTLRGNRYQVLEGEFYRYVLAPHDDVLKEVYGVGAAEIAAGFQDMADATRSGQVNAIVEMVKQFEAVQAFAAQQKKPLEDVLESWVTANEDLSKIAGQALNDMFRGGITNVSSHTKLPQMLLADLAYQRGEEVEFFAPGDFAGTPYRTLPARKKPLIKLESGYYAVDPCFTRDSGYRALLYNLLQRKPEYKRDFEDRQKMMSEGAFFEILEAQLPGAKIYQEVYYKDPVTKQWSENDTLVLIDDVLFLVEAKAGAAATIASPALDFKRHAQSVQDLVIKAYKQCERFFNYLNSSDEVPLYQLVGGKYEECGRISRLSYRVMVPIGLTVESFSPFSAYCKELPQIEPLLGKHSFVSMSIDDLFVLKRFLPTPGVFAHYMEVRQAVASIRHALLFDEFDHLGAYITKNRFDLDILEQLKNGKVDILLWNGMSDIVDKSFEGEDWETKPMTTQDFPNDVLKLLGALESTRTPGWLSVDSHIRDYGEQARNDLARMLSDFGRTLGQHPARYFAIAGDGKPLFVWMQRAEHELEWKKINDKARAIALCTKSSNVACILVEVSVTGAYSKAHIFEVDVPVGRTDENAHIFEDAECMGKPSRAMSLRNTATSDEPKITRKIGRNEVCPCGSGIKYKRCHGR